MIFEHVTARSRHLARAVLDMGRFALEDGAKHLLATAKRLDTWSARLDPAAGEAPGAPSEPATEASADLADEPTEPAEAADGGPAATADEPTRTEASAPSPGALFGRQLEETPSVTGHEETIDLS